jgi:hypothetical protein
MAVTSPRASKESPGELDWRNPLYLVYAGLGIEPQPGRTHVGGSTFRGGSVPVKAEAPLSAVGSVVVPRRRRESQLV